MEVRVLVQNLGNKDENLPKFMRFFIYIRYYRKFKDEAPSSAGRFYLVSSLFPGLRALRMNAPVGAGRIKLH